MSKNETFDKENDRAHVLVTLLGVLFWVFVAAVLIIISCIILGVI